MLEADAHRRPRRCRGAHRLPRRRKHGRQGSVRSSHARQRMGGVDLLPSTRRPEEEDRMTTAYATSADGLTWDWHGTVLAPRPGRWDARGARLDRAARRPRRVRRPRDEGGELVRADRPCPAEREPAASSSRRTTTRPSMRATSTSCRRRTAAPHLLRGPATRRESRAPHRAHTTALRSSPSLTRSSRARRRRFMRYIASSASQKECAGFKSEPHTATPKLAAVCSLSAIRCATGAVSCSFSSTRRARKSDWWGPRPRELVALSH